MSNDELIVTLIKAVQDHTRIQAYRENQPLASRVFINGRGHTHAALNTRQKELWATWEQSVAELRRRLDMSPEERDRELIDRS